MGLITEYKCTHCGAALAFDASSGQVRCDYCGTEMSVGDIIDSQEIVTSTEEFDWGNYKAGLSGEILSNTAVYQCQSCGAILETDKSTAATTCPYCDSNVVLTDRVAGGMKPNALIPFAIDKKELKERVHAFYRDKKLLPKNFFNDNKIDEILGVYIPFWLFDCTVEGSVNFRGDTESIMETPRERVVTTRNYHIVRDGEVSFRNVPVDASTKMDNALMDSIEPYDFSKMVPFDGAYLAGFYADRFDSDPDSEIGRANRRVLNSTKDAIYRTVVGYTNLREYSNSLRMKNANVKYVLLPAYIINCEYAGKKYRYAVNGQTGKIVGELPSSNSLAWGFFFKWFGIAAGAVLLLGQLL